MFDTVDLTLSKEQCRGTDFLNEVPGHLTRVKSEGNNDFGRYVNGTLGNLKINITENKVRVYDSSICKFHLGNNFGTLSRGDYRRAIQKLSDSLHLPFECADVHRVDFAGNIILRQPEKLYYPYLGEARNYKRLMQNNGLYFSNGKRQLLFYGKVKEQTLKGEPIPELYRGRNVLRYEIRFIKRLREQFNSPEIKAKTLYEESFYRELVLKWRNEYLNISKIKKCVNMRVTTSKKELVENLALMTILDVGQGLVLNKIKQWQEGGDISKKQAYDLRQTVRRLSKIQVGETENELIAELDEKVKQVARVY